jgi:6-phosphogluconate dehydrogenase
MIHNGIEQGMLGVLNESWEMLFKCLHTPLDELSKIFGNWTRNGELVFSTIPLP